MQRIFKNNSFSQYSVSSLYEAQQPIEKSFRHDAFGYREGKNNGFYVAQTR